MVAIHDQFIFPDNRRAAVAVYAGKHAGTHLPNRFAGIVVSGHDHFFLVEKRNVHVRTVGDRRAGGAAVQPMDAFQWGLHHGAVPQDLAVGAIHAMEESVLFFFVAGH